MNISANSPVRRTQGDFGEWRGDYTTQQQGDGHLEIVGEIAVLVAEHVMVPGDPKAGGDAKGCKRRSAPALEWCFRGQYQHEGQRQRHVQRPADQVGHKAGKDQPEMKGDGNGAERRPDQPGREGHQVLPSGNRRNLRGGRKCRGPDAIIRAGHVPGGGAGRGQRPSPALRARPITSARRPGQRPFPRSSAARRDGSCP